MKRFLLPAIAVLAATALAIAPAFGSNGGAKQWRVTIENLTPPGPGAPGSQPLSPPLVVVHSNKADVWSVGDIASHGVAAIAEDADNSVLESALDGFPGVKSVGTASAEPIPSGSSHTFMVETSGAFSRLTILTMLVNTNDAFTGLDSAQLQGPGAAYETNAYDAGSETNNEDAGFIPGPCCGNPFVRAPEGEVIRPHGGISGGGDLDPALYDWEDPVARITIERVD
jgi:hypothetical protein